MELIDSPTVIRPNGEPAGRATPIDPGADARRADPGSLVRERAAAIFGTAGESPPGPPEHLPGVPVFGAGPLGRARAWLYVRCGLELKAVVALVVVLAVAGGLAFQHYWSGRPRTVRVPPPAVAPLQPLAVKPAAAAEVTVDIAGKVAQPGLRSLRKGSRVADALAAAGGPLPGTDTTALNLARPLTDGEQILVGVTPPPDASAGTPTDAAVSLNSATLAQLDALPGVGPVLAQHILDYRSQHGAFTSLDQLRQIPGIGPRKFATLKPLVHP
ncbi:MULTISPECIES: ComEA family DNA-binding protein [unclassified Streptomyces]|uniref:ComEA family DNA-binding protein n=1 Tax=unclassified Streptomyces TaxID=2593676 RepID=UPI002E2B2624|nr:ComEA family DNA-binding protein [Streptomyces sp. NBC_00223]